MEKLPKDKTAQKKGANEQASPLLERYLQKNMTDRMQGFGDEELAKAIQTLLYQDSEKNKHLN